MDSREVLEKVTQLPIKEWNYKGDANAKHLGPVAQDFKAAFDLGSDDKSISTIDEGGVALAAIQGLNQKLDKELKWRAEEIELLQKVNASLEKRLANLEKLVNTLSKR